MRRFAGAACLASFLLSIGFVLAFAHDANAEIVVKPWVQMFTHYQYNMSGYEDYDSRFATNDQNSFDVSQARLWVDSEFTEHWSGRLVLFTARSKEVSYETTTIGEDDPETDEDESTEAVTSIQETKTGPYVANIFYAYATYQPFQWLGVDFGLVQSSYIPTIYKFWKYRYIMKPLMFEYSMNRATTGDFGVAVHGSIPGGYGGYRMRVSNGEGKANMEQNKGKAAEVSTYLFPFQSVDALKRLALFAFYRYDKVQPNYQEEIRTTWDVMLSYALDIDEGMGFSVNGELASTITDIDNDALDPNPVVSQGISAWAEFWFAKKYGLLLRWDSYDPNTENDEDLENGGYQDETTMLLAGLWAEPIKQIRICPNYRTVNYTAEIEDDEKEMVAMQPDQYIFVNAEIKFK